MIFNMKTVIEENVRMKRKLILRLLSFFVVFSMALSINNIDSHAEEEYTIVVNVTQNVVTIYQAGQPVKAMVCSTGTYTPKSGTYRTSSKYRWHALVGGVYGQYCTRITGQILFHSVPYTRNGDESSVEYWEYDKLGTSASLGCVRLCVEDAKWIYDNCPSSTSVTFVTGDDMPLGKPTSYIISDSPERFRGWDPTDPADNNPWNIMKYDSCFDAVYYADKYSDLKNIYGYDDKMLAVHWVTRGINEERQASSEFDIKYYKNTYSDLSSIFGNDNYAYVLHYIHNGKSEGRAATLEDDGTLSSVYNGVDYSAVYDYTYYINRYSDLKEVFGDNQTAAFLHFVDYGMKEGRQGNEEFDVIAYRNAYPDLDEAFQDELPKYYLHYINSGKNEGRKAVEEDFPQEVVTEYNGIDYSAVYDYDYYINNNQDVYKAYGDNYLAVLKHFVDYGMREGRVASDSFNIISYKTRYPDLQNEFGDDNERYYLHYINNGIKENRIGN
ncbi:MAG: L,D-transpeptidase [Lachnospiraceae bacterium]|nr:L,D-transpeptidase [Lachnospiraceae bacterium]